MKTAAMTETQGDIHSQRWLNVAPSAIYAACVDPERLARWWGPAGFSNTFHVCDPRPGGDWRFTMQGPDGTAFEMDNRFIELLPDERVVIGHDQPGHTFTLTIGLEPENGGTRLSWLMRFDPPADAEPVRDAILAANEQNFDKLEAELTRVDASVKN